MQPASSMRCVCTAWRLPHWARCCMPSRSRQRTASHLFSSPPRQSTCSWRMAGQSSVVSSLLCLSSYPSITSCLYMAPDLSRFSRLSSIAAFHPLVIASALDCYPEVGHGRTYLSLAFHIPDVQFVRESTAWQGASRWCRYTTPCRPLSQV